MGNSSHPVQEFLIHDLPRSISEGVAVMSANSFEAVIDMLTLTAGSGIEMIQLEVEQVKSLIATIMLDTGWPSRARMMLKKV